jgi:hypothetical protein
MEEHIKQAFGNDESRQGIVGPGIATAIVAAIDGLPK